MLPNDGIFVNILFIYNLSITARHYSSINFIVNDIKLSIRLQHNTLKTSIKCITNAIKYYKIHQNAIKYTKML